MLIKKIYYIFGLGLACCFATSFTAGRFKPSTDKVRLSEYAFFKGELKDQLPADGVVPYELNMPLFTDYAVKRRFVVLPKGTSADFNPDSVLQFPVGTVLIKTFCYPIDERKPTLGFRNIETRLLINDAAKGWTAMTYVWDEAQSDALLEVAGDSKMVQYVDAAGKKHNFEYFVPNSNQCKGCHNKHERMTPIGPSARQLNGNLTYNTTVKNQLLHWKEIGLLSNLPDLSTVKKAASWSSADLDAKARTYLDINCAHCHNKSGPASSSGLFLEYNQQDSTALGFNKAPVAAGKGSGNLQFDLLKGKPKSSILWFRMQSRDPGVMMPELGRTLLHEEGLQLIKEWIAKM